MSEDDRSDDAHDATRVGGAQAPKLPRIGGAGAAPSGEGTEGAGRVRPPAAPRPPAAGDVPPAGKGLEEGTQRVTAPPPRAPGAPPAAPAAAPGAPAAARGPGVAPPLPPAAAAPSVIPPALEEEGGTVVLAGPARASVRLLRLEPAGRSEIIALGATHYLVGRQAGCDIRLYSATGSREHARLTQREGRWYLQPLEHKTVLVNGDAVREEILLTHKMRLRFGDDELLFVDDAAAAAHGEAGAAPAALRPRIALLWAAAGALVALALALWFLGGR